MVITIWPVGMIPIVLWRGFFGVLITNLGALFMHLSRFRSLVARPFVANLLINVNFATP